MARSISKDETIKLFSQVLASLAEIFGVLIKVDCQGEHAPPQVDLLLLLSVIERELKALLCAILRPNENHDEDARKFVENHCCKVVLRGCSALVELLHRRLLLYMGSKGPGNPTWTEILTYLGDYRMHLLPLNGNPADQGPVNWPTVLANLDKDESSAQHQLADFRSQYRHTALSPALVEPGQPNNARDGTAPASAHHSTADQPQSQPPNVATTPYEEGLKHGQEMERRRLLDALDVIGLLGDSPQKKATRLLKAIGNRSAECVQLLIDKGADVNGIATQNEDLPLTAAARSGGSEIIEVLLKNDADIHNRSKTSGDTAILAAAAAGNIDGLKILLDRGASLTDTRTCEPELGYTPIMLAVSYGHTATVKFLVEGFEIGLCTSTR
ncbi:ankyrin repeat-containing domain protein [Clohesyomyces aquaticus]|uniref:Ankyrin repeat-containing domain protein n=1 Tax=Clohesyomyces aquaticus TaxID=1231657 RepID=A0A1Y2A9G4_9PLEO|nr:ankyrin repeat-containing domain protein [Clohesyomyces aquaticus]